MIETLQLSDIRLTQNHCSPVWIHNPSTFSWVVQASCIFASLPVKLWGNTARLPNVPLFQYVMLSAGQYAYLPKFLKIVVPPSLPWRWRHWLAPSSTDRLQTLQASCIVQTSQPFSVTPFLLPCSQKPILVPTPCQINPCRSYILIFWTWTSMLSFLLHLGLENDFSPSGLRTKIFCISYLSHPY